MVLLYGNSFGEGRLQGFGIFCLYNRHSSGIGLFSDLLACALPGKARASMSRITWIVAIILSAMQWAPLIVSGADAPLPALVAVLSATTF